VYADAHNICLTYTPVHAWCSTTPVNACRLSAEIYMDLYIYIHIYTYVCTHTHAYCIHIYMYTYTYTYTVCREKPSPRAGPTRLTRPFRSGSKCRAAQQPLNLPANGHRPPPSQAQEATCLACTALLFFFGFVLVLCFFCWVLYHCTGFARLV